MLTPASGVAAAQTAPDITAPGATVAKMEMDLIHRTLDSTKGNRTRAAKMLGVSIRTLRNKLNEYKARKEKEESE